MVCVKSKTYAFWVSFRPLGSIAKYVSYVDRLGKAKLQTWSKTFMRLVNKSYVSKWVHFERAKPIFKMLSRS